MKIKLLKELPTIKSPLKPEKPIDHSIGFHPEGLHFERLRRQYLSAMRKYKNELRLYYHKMNEGKHGKD